MSRLSRLSSSSTPCTTITIITIAIFFHSPSSLSLRTGLEYFVREFFDDIILWCFSIYAVGNLSIYGLSCWFPTSLSLSRVDAMSFFICRQLFRPSNRLSFPPFIRPSAHPIISPSTHPFINSSVRLSIQTTFQSIQPSTTHFHAPLNFLEHFFHWT